MVSLALFSPVNAQFQKRTNTFNGYSIIGLHVLHVSFHSMEYSWQRLGNVKDMYFEYWAWFPNSIRNAKTWKSYHPYGQYANGSVDIGAGLDSPFGAIDIFTQKKIFSTLY